MYFFLLVFKNPDEFSKEGIIIISLLKLRNLRLALVPKGPSMLAICVLAGG